MALDEPAKQVLVVFRSPARLAAFSTQDGARVAMAETCGDADDVLVDAKRHRAYVTCGEGYLDVFGQDGTAYRRVGHIATAPGARTAFFGTHIECQWLAVRATSAEPAAIRVYRPQP